MLKKYIAHLGLFLDNAAKKGFLLFGAAIAAIIVVNSGFEREYAAFFQEYLTIKFGNNSISLSILHWINDFLMAIFFFVVGMEIKRELIMGHLSTNKQRVLPVIAAFGGVAVPIIVYLFYNGSYEIESRGWAIPAATDIAFMLGVVGLFGKSVPTSLRVFVMSLAIIDDLIAVVIIAFFYTTKLNHIYFLYIALCVSILIIMNLKNISSKSLYIIIGLIMWCFFLHSGIHPSIGGVVLGVLIPLKTKNDNHFIESFINILNPLVSYIIIPLFAFANSGVILSHFKIETVLSPVVAGIILGLFLGKQIGIFLSSYILIKLKLAQMPEKSSMVELYAMSVLCGIGFTMSIFISTLSFQSNIKLFECAKIGIIIGSILSFILGSIILKFCYKRKISKIRNENAEKLNIL